MQLIETNKSDQTVLDAAFAGQASVKMRLAPSLYNAATQNYRAWAGVSWGVTLESVDEARAFKDALDYVLQAMGDLGIQAVKKAVEERY